MIFHRQPFQTRRRARSTSPVRMFVQLWTQTANGRASRGRRSCAANAEEEGGETKWWFWSREELRVLTGRAPDVAVGQSAEVGYGLDRLVSRAVLSESDLNEVGVDGRLGTSGAGKVVATGDFGGRKRHVWGDQV